MDRLFAQQSLTKTTYHAVGGLKESVWEKGGKRSYLLRFHSTTKWALLYKSVFVCVCVCVYSQESDALRSELSQIAWKPHFSLFNSLYGDYTERNVIGPHALCHCLALSIKLTTIANPPIVHAEWLLSATVSWQWGENERLSPAI